MQWRVLPSCFINHMPGILWQRLQWVRWLCTNRSDQNGRRNLYKLLLKATYILSSSCITSLQEPRVRLQSLFYTEGPNQNLRRNRTLRSSRLTSCTVVLQLTHNPCRTQRAWSLFFEPCLLNHRTLSENTWRHLHLVKLLPSAILIAVVERFNFGALLTELRTSYSSATGLYIFVFPARSLENFILILFFNLLG